MAKPDIEPDGEAMAHWESAADEAIALCGGDTREAVIALLVVNEFLEREIRLARVAVSAGFSRGWHRDRAQSDGGFDAPCPLARDD